MYHPAQHARPVIPTREVSSAGHRSALFMPASRPAPDRRDRHVVKGEQAPSQPEFYRMFIVVLLLSTASVAAGVLVGLLSAYLRS